MLNLRNNKYGLFTDIEKIKMSQDEHKVSRFCTSHYEILVSSMIKGSEYRMGYRQLSRHKQSLKIELYQ